MNSESKKTSVEAFALNVSEVQTLLGVGRDTARKIGIQSGAAFKIGSRTLYRKDRIIEYINSLSERMD